MKNRMTILCLVLCVLFTNIVRADDHGDTWQTATVILPEVSEAGEVNPKEDVDYFKITLTKDNQYNIEVLLGTLNDSRMWLFDTDGTTQIAYDDDGGSGAASLINYNCTVSGDYYLKIDSYANNYTGTYDVLASGTWAYTSDPYLSPYQTPDKEIFFEDFNGDGRADMAVRTITGGTNGDVDIYFQSFYDPQPRLINGDFETGNLTGWTKTGNAFDLSPTTSNGGGLFSGWEGSWYVNSRINSQTSPETATGTLTSSPFALTNQFISFFITGWSSVNGGSGSDWNYVTVHLASDDSELDRVYAPNQTDGMIRRMLDAGLANIGEQVYIKVTDDRSIAGYAWLAVDSFKIGGQFARHIFNTEPDISATGITVNNTTNWDLLFADINGDGNADLINHYRDIGNVYVHYNLGSGFSSTISQIFTSLIPTDDKYKAFFKDINADGFDDYIILDRETGYVEIFRNISGTFESTAYVTQTIGTISYPFNGNESLLADVTGDGKADFINFDQIEMTFTCHENLGSGFDISGKTFRGLSEKFEHQYFLEDFDADGLADLAQLSLRKGDVIVHNIFPTRTDGLDVDTDAFFRHVDAPGFTVPSQGRDVINLENHSVNCMILYEIDNMEWDARPDNGWWNLNPNNPGIVPGPSQPPYTGDERWRTTTPLLGTYDIRDPEIIKQHAYWMRAMGVDTVLLDLTNVTSTKQTTSHVYEFTLRVHDAMRAILDTYSTITEFVPPKVVVAIRMQEEYSPFTITQEVADEMWEMYSLYPELMFKFYDNSSGQSKPILLAFSNFADPAWSSTGPVWSDSRFNMRYTNGDLKDRGLTTYEDADWERITNDLPYWAFVESIDKAGSPGYYRNIYRRLPGTSVSELAITWIALYNGGYIWDGQLDLVDGKYLIERYSQPLYTKAPRITFLNRWCYPKGWYNEPQEGLSLNYSTIIEPSVDLGFDNFDRTADVMYDLRGLVKHLPGKPVIESVVGGKDIVFKSSNWPTQYKVSDDKDGIGEDWEYINVNNPTIELPVALQNKPFYLRTKNSFGQSQATKYGYTFGDAGDFFENWLNSCSSPTWCDDYDLNQSDEVDFKDFAIVSEEWLD